MDSIKKISYIDAYYSYENQTAAPKGEILLYGNIINESKLFVDIKIGWSIKNKKIYFGLVIPTGSIEPFSNKNFNQFIGKVVGVYWDDIFAYNEDYSGPHRPTQMYTEGIMTKQDQKYIWITDPETINMNKRINHPNTKPKIYIIPKGMINNIQNHEK